MHWWLTLLLVMPVCLVATAHPQAGRPQSRRPQSPSATHASAASRNLRHTSLSSSQTNAETLELQQRIDAATRAQATGEVTSIEDANRRVIALALRRMGGLRIIQGAWPESIACYKRALEFEEVAAAHVDLAIAFMRAKRIDDALHESATALVMDDNDARAWQVQGKVLMMKQDFRGAVQPLAKSVSLQPDLEAAYALGISLLQLHDKQKAALVFQQMLDVGGDRAGLHVLFARAYRDVHYVDDAIRELHRAIAMDAKTTRAHYFLGLLYMVQNEWAPTPAAVEQFQAEVKLNPRDFFGNYFLGVIRSGEKRYDESDAYLKIAADAHPDWPEPWLYLGLNASGRGDKDAEPMLRKAIQLTGADEERNNYQIRRAYYALGRILITSGRKEEGERAIAHSRALQQSTLDQSHQKLAGMGVAGVIDAQNVAESQSDADAVSNVQPASASAASFSNANLTPQEKSALEKSEQQLSVVLANAFNDLGTAEARSRSYEVALVHFREAQHWNPTMPLLSRNIGIAAVRLGRYADAVSPLREALTTDPQDAMTRSLLGLSLFMTDDYRAAATVFTPLGRTVLADAGIAYAAAASLARTGDAEHSRELLDEMEKQPLAPELLVSIGQTRSDAGDYEGALRSLHRALEQDAAAPKAHYYAGLALIRLDRPADAAQELRTELVIRPDDPDVKYHLAYALLQLSNKSEAVTLLEQVVASHPEHAQAHYQLGKTLLDEGKLKQAIDELEIAARLNPQLDYIHYQLQAAYRKDARLAEADRELKLYRDLKARNRQQTMPQPDEHP
jgi:tetratricopeptide (TPR) repeat protein